MSIVLHISIDVVNCLTFGKFPIKHFFGFNLMLVCVTVFHAKAVSFRHADCDIAVLMNPASTSPPRITFAFGVIAVLAAHVASPDTITLIMLALFVSAASFVRSLS